MLLVAQAAQRAFPLPAAQGPGAANTPGGLASLVGANPAMLELTRVRKELLLAECGKDAYTGTAPCKGFRFSQLLSKTQDVPTRSKLIKDHRAEIKGRTPEQKKRAADEGWRATKSMYMDFCATAPTDSKVCTNSILKQTYERDSRPIPGAKGSPSLIDKLGTLIKG